MWNQLPVPASTLYSWDPNSTYIHEPPYFKNITVDPPGPHGVKDAYCLLSFGDSITTDHISPAGSIHKDSPAAKYLLERGVDRKDFNSYGSRRGNDEVMARGTFANIRIVNKLLSGEVGPMTIHIPTGEKLYVYDAAMVSVTIGIKNFIALTYTIITNSEYYLLAEVQEWWARHYCLSWIRVWKWQFTRLGCQRSNATGEDTVLLFFNDIICISVHFFKLFSISCYSPFSPQWFFCFCSGSESSHSQEL